MDSMKVEMNEMRVRTAQLQNHAREKMQEAEDIKKEKFMNEAMIKKTVGSVVTGCCRCWNHSWSQIWTFLDKHTNCRNAQTRADIGCQFKLPLICINKS